MKVTHAFFSILALFICLDLHAVHYNIQTQEPHRVQTIEYGAQALQLRLNMIERAKESIDLETFIYKADETGRIFTEALIRKKMENPDIKIRILMDFCPFNTNLNYYEAAAIRKKGIEFKFYNPSMSTYKGPMRDHRKLLIIDGKEVITGGRNIGDEYFDLRKDFNFLDRDIWTEGSIVKEIKESFDAFWNFKESIVPHEPKRPLEQHHRDKTTPFSKILAQYKTKIEKAAKFASLFDENEPMDVALLKLKERYAEFGDKQIKEEPVMEVKSLSFISDGPDWKSGSDKITGTRYYAMLAPSKKVLIETPYLYLKEYELSIFAELKKKGVEATLMINDKHVSNEFAVNYLSLRQGISLAKNGHKIVLNQGKFMQDEQLPMPEVTRKALWTVHSKTLLIDDRHTWIGSFNMDPRSLLRINAELALVVEDEEFNKRVSQHLNERIAASVPLDNNGKTPEGKNPSKVKLFDNLSKLKLLPLLMFENQI